MFSNSHYPDKPLMDRTGCERSELQIFIRKKHIVENIRHFKGMGVLHHLGLLKNTEKCKITMLFHSQTY